MPTPETPRLYEEVEQLWNRVERIEDLTRALANPEEGALSVSISPSLGTTVAPAAVTALLARAAPDHHIELLIPARKKEILAQDLLYPSGICDQFHGRRIRQVQRVCCERCRLPTICDAAHLTAAFHQMATSRNMASDLDAIEAAREFVLDRVQRPALQSDSLRGKIKDKVRHANIWLNEFKRVGDLHSYLKRFRQEKNDPVYLEMKALGLNTFEDITPEFEKRFSLWLHDCTRATDFVVGEKYSAYDILIFSGSYDTRAGGMFVLHGEADPIMVVIKATLSGGSYANEWLEPSRRLKYYFKSIRQNGQRVFAEHFQANAAILENRNIPILTFVRTSQSEDFRFQGLFCYATHHTGSDASRWFELVRKEQPTSVIADSVFVENELADQVRAALLDPPEQRRLRLAIAPKKPLEIVIRSTAYIRNADVVAEVLWRANGSCERCYAPGPFIGRARGTPYLEVHHRVRLTDGGDDTVENAIALCPNCHREQHFG